MSGLSLRSITLIVFLLTLIHKGYSQDKIFVANGDDIGYIDLADFTYKFIATTPGFVDLAITPQGKYYGISGTALYEVNPVTGASTLIPLTSNDTYFNGGHSMVSDRNGDLYVAGSNFALYKIDMKTATLSLVGGTNMMAAGDLSFSEGKLYMIANGNYLVEMVLAPGGSSILSERTIGAISVEGGIYSIAINENGICYVVTTSQELALVDLEDATTYVISKPIKGPITSVWGAAMLLEGYNDKDIEICGNGLDDDHNGYMDDNDMACRLKRGICNTDGQQIFQEDFGKGIGIGKPLSGLGNGAYLFSSTPPLAEGYYTIVDNPATAGGNPTWKNMTDHSGQVGGRMLVVNGSYKPSEFYRRKVTGLCAGLQYAISVSACSVISASMFCGTDVTPIPSRIRFRIEDEYGKPLGQLAERYISANPAPAAKWKEYGMMFTLPEGVTTIQIVLLDDAPGGCGNDLAVDDIVFSTCRPLQPVSINGGTSSYTGCQLTRATLKVDTNGLKLRQPVLQWQKLNATTALWEDISGAHNDTYTIEELLPPDAGQYRAIIRENLSTSCRKEAISIAATLMVSANVSVKVSPTIIACMGSPLQLQAKSNQVLAEVLWLGPDGYPYWEQSPEITQTATAAHAGEYIMKATGIDGCIGAFSTQVTVAEIRPPDFTFTPSMPCIGQAIRVTANGNNLTNWQWNASGPHDITGSGTATPQITWNAAGTYDVTLKGAGQCVVNEPVTHTITVQGLPERGHLTLPAHVCLGTPLMLTVADATGTLSWQVTGTPIMSGPAEKTVVTWQEAGTYMISYNVKNACGTTSLPSPLPIRVQALPSISLINDTTICRGSHLLLQAVHSSNIVSFSWQNGPFVIDSRYTASKAGLYTVVAQDEWGCKKRDDVIIQEKSCGCDIFIPNAFSPNGDGTNDLFRPVVHCAVTSYQLRVFNRWGQLLFATQTPNIGWNGTLPNGSKADIGTYTWVVEYKSSESPDLLRQMGAVTLVQ